MKPNRRQFLALFASTALATPALPRPGLGLTSATITVSGWGPAWDGEIPIGSLWQDTTSGQLHVRRFDGWQRIGEAIA